ncbi:hypothetical protein B0H63DRAFT_480491 [Podospora didyma]|uniref:Lipocalin-like domain-containing protein n=1 Tax=Podospora didyma TaxID=330526 RepID=A0AAE0N9N1_9PEZI|nr:hypothetical protein B0H63DRAFT_480491 [Podospora didyma]
MPSGLGLDHNAIITLRPPSALNDNEWLPPTLNWLDGRWHITHSTLPHRTTQRNTRIELTISAAANGKQSFHIESSHQALEASKPKTESVSSPSQTPLDFSASKGTASRFGSWQILAWGKEGQLDDWMIEDGDGWISDSSGERRADWRNSYVVVHVEGDGEDEKEKGDGPGIEVWSRRGWWKPLYPETVGKIKDALKGAGLEYLAEKLVGVALDDTRGY